MSVDPSLNPYAPPQTALAASPVQESQATHLALYSPRAVSVAAFFGSFGAAAVLLAVNYSRLGRRRAAWWMFGLGWIGNLVCLLVSILLLPEEVPGILITVPQVVLAHLLTTKLQGPAIDEHLERGGKLASIWWALGIAILVLVAVLLNILLLALVIPADWLPIAE